LAVVGTALQALVRNPLADPYVFGITSGASVGATAVLIFGVTIVGQQSVSAAAFLGAVVAFALVLVLARLGGGLSPARLILAGVAVAYTMSALTSFLVFMARTTSDQGIAQAVLFWLLGSLGGARWDQLGIPAVAVVCGTALLVLQARSLNALLVGDETAATLGVDPRRFRGQLFVLCALLTGVIVAVAGGIGFVGLMVPHTVRMLVGADHRRVLPVAMLLGATFLIWADVLARTVASPLELPIGIVTALFGTPFFVLIMRQRGKALRAGSR
ncbi:MAG: FecCD family ABC transporter permease, partial [Pseudonocardiaceae bacterium]